MAAPDARGEIRLFWRTFSRNQLAVCGGAVVLVLVTLAVLAPVLAPFDPNRPDTKKILNPPSRSHWLGTDPLGRDVLSGVLYGSRVSLAVGFVSVGIAATIGPIDDHVFLHRLERQHLLGRRRSSLGRRIGRVQRGGHRERKSQ